MNRATSYEPADMSVGVHDSKGLYRGSHYKWTSVATNIIKAISLKLGAIHQ